MTHAELKKKWDLRKAAFKTSGPKSENTLTTLLAAETGTCSVELTNIDRVVFG